MTKLLNMLTVWEESLGEDRIALLWKDHFNELYNSVQDHSARESFFARIKSSVGNFETCLFSIQEMRDAINKQKKGKAAGPDGIAMEAFIYGNMQLSVHLSLLFNLFIMHCHIPSVFMQSVIVHLVKAKGGDLTDFNNYRAIALSNPISMI